MKIVVNGEARDVKAQTLAALLVELELDGALVATALNRDFVRKQDRAAAALKDGDSVEILTPRQGG